MRAVDTAHRNTRKPQRGLNSNGGPVVAGSGTMAALVDCRGPLAWANGDLNAVSPGTEAGMAVDEPPEAMTAGWKASGGEASTTKRFQAQFVYLSRYAVPLPGDRPGSQRKNSEGSPF